MQRNDALADDEKSLLDVVTLHIILARIEIRIENIIMVVSSRMIECSIHEIEYDGFGDTQSGVHSVGHGRPLRSRIC